MTIVRIVEAAAGRPVARLRLRPLCDYGAREPETQSGSHHLSFICASARYRLTTDCSLSAIADQSPIVIDQPIALLLGPDETVEEAPLLLARSLLDATRSYWQDWVRGLSIPAEWQDAVIRAAITLKLCTYEDTGAMVAALTACLLACAVYSADTMACSSSAPEKPSLRAASAFMSCSEIVTARFLQ